MGQVTSGLLRLCPRHSQAGHQPRDVLFLAVRLSGLAVDHGWAGNALAKCSTDYHNSNHQRNPLLPGDRLPLVLHRMPSISDWFETTFHRLFANLDLHSS